MMILYFPQCKKCNSRFWKNKFQSFPKEIEIQVIKGHHIYIIYLNLPETRTAIYYMNNKILQFSFILNIIPTTAKQKLDTILTFL
jgi:hypothetical protein